MWLLDRAAFAQSLDAEKHLRKARDIYDEVHRCVTGLQLTEALNQLIQVSLRDLRARLDGDGKV